MGETADLFSLVALAFQNGLDYRRFDYEELICDSLAKL